jgi:hypothetical protein
MQTWLPCESNTTKEHSPSGKPQRICNLLVLQTICPITVHTFRTKHILGRTNAAVTPQLVSSPLPGCVRYIPYYVKISQLVQK